MNIACCACLMACWGGALELVPVDTNPVWQPGEASLTCECLIDTPGGSYAVGTVYESGESGESAGRNLPHCIAVNLATRAVSYLEVRDPECEIRLFPLGRRGQQSCVVVVTQWRDATHWDDCALWTWFPDQQSVRFSGNGHPALAKVGGAIDLSRYRASWTGDDLESPLCLRTRRGGTAHGRTLPLTPSFEDAVDEQIGLTDMFFLPSRTPQSILAVRKEVAGNYGTVRIESLKVGCGSEREWMVEIPAPTSDSDACALRGGMANPDRIPILRTWKSAASDDFECDLLWVDTRSGAVVDRHGFPEFPVVRPVLSPGGNQIAWAEAHDPGQVQMLGLFSVETRQTKVLDIFEMGLVYVYPIAFLDESRLLVADFDEIAVIDVRGGGSATVVFSLPSDQ